MSDRGWGNSAAVLQLEVLVPSSAGGRLPSHFTLGTHRYGTCNSTRAAPAPATKKYTVVLRCVDLAHLDTKTVQPQAVDGNTWRTFFDGVGLSEFEPGWGGGGLLEEPMVPAAEA